MLSPCPRRSGALWVLSWLLKNPFFIPPAAPAPSLGLCLITAPSPSHAAFSRCKELCKQLDPRQLDAKERCYIHGPRPYAKHYSSANKPARK